MICTEFGILLTLYLHQTPVKSEQTLTVQLILCAQGSAYFKSENVAWTFAYAAPELLLNANCSAKVSTNFSITSHP